MAMASKLPSAKWIHGRLAGILAVAATGLVFAITLVLVRIHWAPLESFE
jgi:hypothetical protein